MHAARKGRQRDDPARALAAVRARDGPRRQRGGIEVMVFLAAILAHDVQPVLAAVGGGVLRHGDGDGVVHRP